MATTGDRLTTQEQNVTVQKGTKVLTPPARTRPTTPAEQEVDTVQVWPHLVVIEFLGAVVITINLVLLSTLFNGPLLGLANPDQTPNPSKAPWYFLNLQELLLHMNPALAGVIVPTVALGLIAIIPYVDRGSRGLGVVVQRARQEGSSLLDCVHHAITSSLIALDNFGKLKARFDEWLSVSDPATGTQAGPLSFMTEALGGVLGGTATATAEAQGILIETIVNWLIPIFFLTFFPVLLVLILKRVYKGIDLSEIIIALFTGFVVVYFLLTFVGTAMRGPGMELYPPGHFPATHE